MNDKAPDSSALVVVEPVEPDTSEEEARSKDFAALMAEVRALKPGDVAGVQDLLYKAAGKAARDKITPLQAQMLVEAIKKSTGFKMEGLSKTFKKFFKTAQKEAEAEAAAAASGPGAGAGPGPSSASTYYYAVGDFIRDDIGLWHKVSKNKWRKIAQSFEVLGHALDAEGDDWSKFIRFTDLKKRVHEEIVTRELLHSDAGAVISRLAFHGMDIEGTTRDRLALAQFLLAAEANEFAIMARSTGWIRTSAGRTFVLPGEIIGATGSERIILATHIRAPYAQQGTLDQWREAVAKPAGSHLMMRLSISTSLAGPLLYLGGFESGLLHFWGISGKGKTTMLRVAVSSWGSGADGGYMQTWHTTANALEGTLASMSDTLLALDDIAQANSHEIGAVVYKIAGTVGKMRMRRDGGIRSPYKWRSLALSTGEDSIASLISEDQKSKRPRARQLVRALDIPAKRALGMFDKAHPGFDADVFAKELAAAASKFYGTAGLAFIRQLIERDVTSERVRKLVGEFVAVALKDVDKNNHGQLARVAERFGLIAVAGKLATEFGIVSWPDGQVALDALELFKDWFAARGGAAPAEIEQMIALARGFIEKYGDSHFDNLDPPPNNPITGSEIPWRKASIRAGYRKGEGEDQRWYVLPEAWRKDICAGFDPHDVAKTLAEKGMLEPGEGCKMSRVVRLPEQSPKLFYVLTPAIFEG
jgi:putative DNA primase/helicase